MAKETIPTKVVTGKVRFCYAHVFEPTSVGDDTANLKYSVSILIPKDDTKIIAKIEAAIEAAKVAGTAKFGGKVPKVLKSPLRDGDEERDDETYAGHMFLTANSTIKPGVVDKDLNPIIDKSEFYSGCYGRASINFYAFSTAGNKGIACGLQNLQKLEDGERLAGIGSTPADDFGDDDDLN